MPFFELFRFFVHVASPVDFSYNGDGFLQRKFACICRVIGTCKQVM
jgi:hypothetical protein